MILKYCPNCKDIEFHDFCGKCGEKRTPLEKCPICNEQIYPRKQFCVKCGRPVNKEQNISQIEHYELNWKN